MPEAPETVVRKEVFEAIDWGTHRSFDIERFVIQNSYDATTLLKRQEALQDTYARLLYVNYALLFILMVFLGLFIWDRFFRVHIVEEEALKLSPKMDALAGAMVQLKLDIEGTQDDIERTKEVTINYFCRVRKKMEEDAELLEVIREVVSSNNERFDEIRHALASLPPVTGEKYAEVWGGMTDMFERMMCVNKPKEGSAM